MYVCKTMCCMHICLCVCALVCTCVRVPTEARIVISMGDLLYQSLTYSIEKVSLTQL